MTHRGPRSFGLRNAVSFLAVSACLLAASPGAQSKEEPGLIEILKAEKTEAAKVEGEAAKAESKEAPAESKEKAEKPEGTAGTKETPKEEKPKEEKPKEAAEEATPKEGTAAKPDAAQKAQILKILKEAKENAAKAKAVDAKTAEVKIEAAPAQPPAANDQGAKTEATGEKEKEKEATGKKPEKKKKEPAMPMFRLRDQTRLAGTPDLDVLKITTAYGKLVVPKSEVVRVRFASGKDVSVAAKVEEHIQNLASEMFDVREQAMTALREIGLPALDLLKKALESEDEEVKSRAEKLVSEIEETINEEDPDTVQLGPAPGEEDEVVTFKFTVLGHVEEETFSVATRYGSLKLNRKDILSIVFQEASLFKAVFQVPGATFAAANKWFDTKLSVTQGEALQISATGTINMDNYGQTAGPEGTTNIGGNQLENFPAGSLVAKIGDKGKAFLVGSEFQGSANATGKLFLAISFREGQVSGQFQVEVETESGE